MHTANTIFVAGHNGMVGRAIVGELRMHSYDNLLLPSKEDLDLRDQFSVDKFFKDNLPEIVFLCAARVGGIQANIDRPADFIVDNIQIQTNIIASARLYGVKKLVFMGSSCIYPRNSQQPMKEEYLLTGRLEPTNEYYAMAKLAGIKMLESLGKQDAFSSISLIPCNLYGPNDSFDLRKSHVLSALVKRFVDAVESGRTRVTLWGTGNARREFMHVADIARAALYLASVPRTPEIINVGPGSDVSILQLSQMVAKAAGYHGTIEWDHSRPDGMPRKCMDVTKMLDLGFKPEISLEVGIREMIDMYIRVKSDQREQ